MPGENDDLTLDDQEMPNEGFETEADASGQDGHEDVEGAELEGAAEGDGSEPEVGQEVAGEPRRPTRGEQRFQRLSQSTKEAGERAANAEKRAQELEARLARLERPAPPQERELSREELALMTPDELYDYKNGRAMKAIDQRIGAIQFQAAEAADRSEFQMIISGNPVAARFAQQVEAKLVEMRAQGVNAPRANVLKFLMGEAVFARASSAKPKAAAAGQKRIAQQTVRPGNGQRSDTASNRGKMDDATAREKRLETLTF